jgi:Apea-like HEPN
MDILEVLTNIYQKCKAMSFTETKIGILEALNHPNPEISHLPVVTLHDLGNQLSEAIVQDNYFPGKKVLMICTDSGYCGFYPNFVGSPLLRRALETNSPEDAMVWIKKVLATTAATGKTIHALWGVTVEHEIEITPAVKIVPIEKLSDSPQKSRLISPFFYLADSPIVSALHFEQPKSALVMARRIEPLIVGVDEQSSNLANEEFISIDNLLQDITLVLTIIGPRVALPSAQWFNFDDPDIERASLMSNARRNKFVEIIPIQIQNFPALDPIEAKEIVQNYLGLNESVRDKVRVALERLSRALRRQNVGDKAVELSTAFETLVGDNSTNEMTHKVKVRSVRLIGGTNQIRRKNAAVINKAYSIRSTLVHTGHVDTTKPVTICDEQMSVSDVIDHTVGMCVDLIKIVIRRKSIPDWSIFDIT